MCPSVTRIMRVDIMISRENTFVKKLKTFFRNCFHVKTVKTIRVCRNYVPSIQKEGSVDTRNCIHVS